MNVLAEPRGHPAPFFGLDLPGARVAFSTRLGGLSAGAYESLNLGILTDDDQELVSRNRGLLAETLGLHTRAIAIGVQVHGIELREWNGARALPDFTNPDAELPRVDGHTTERDDLGLLILGADCLPIALAAPGRVAMVHCGWRGLAGGILERAAARFSVPRRLRSDPGSGVAATRSGPRCWRRSRDSRAPSWATAQRPATGCCICAPSLGASWRPPGSPTSGGGPLHELSGGSVLFPPARQRRQRAPGRRRLARRMSAVAASLDAERIRANLERVRERIAAAGGDPQRVEICAATKYVRAEDLPVLAEAGIRLVGENRAQDLLAKQAEHGELFEWDFIGTLQSRKVRDVAPAVRLIHSLSTESALRKLDQLEGASAPAVLVQVNVAGEQGKAGIAPGELPRFLEAAPVPVAGLMTMPPPTGDPERSRPHFARLAELAAENGLEKLSMGTTQDFEAAVAEGATIVRLGSVLYA